MVFEKCRFDELIFSGTRNAENILLKDTSWSNAGGGEIIQAGVGSTMYLEGDIKINGKHVRELDSDIEKRISVAERAAVHLPDGNVLETTLAPKGE